MSLRCSAIPRQDEYGYYIYKPYGTYVGAHTDLTRADVDVCVKIEEDCAAARKARNCPCEKDEECLSRYCNMVNSDAKACSDAPMPLPDACAVEDNVPDKCVCDPSAAPDPCVPWSKCVQSAWDDLGVCTPMSCADDSAICGEMACDPETNTDVVKEAPGACE